MSNQNDLHAGIEHHRAGRLREAEDVYRRILQQRPDDPDALHWLGLLAHHTGRHDVAVGMIGRALQLKPSSSSYFHNYGEVWQAIGEFDQAVRAYEQAIALRPAARESWAAMGIAHLRHGDPARAADAFARAVDMGLQHPNIHHQHGVALLRLGRFDDAVAAAHAALALNPRLADAWHTIGEARGKQKRLDEAVAAFRKAIEIKPDFPRPYHGLGVAAAMAGRLDDAVAAFDKALQLRPDYPEALHGVAAALAARGKLEEAVRRLRRAIDLRPHYLQAHYALAVCCERLGLRHEAAGAYREILRLCGGELPEIQFHLAALEGSGSGAPAPAAAPPQYIAAHFDTYSARFERHLTQTLRYRAPQILFDLLAPLLPPPPRTFDVLDLGCGTGLCGRIIRPRASRLVGVDLSPGMIDKARQAQVYDELHQGELTAFMRVCRQQFDLIVSTDVLIYLGDLAPVFAAARGALRGGGVFAFSVEAGDAEDFTLAPTRRYAHSAAYLRRTAAAHDFTEAAFRRDFLRTEYHEAVDGFYAAFTSAAASA